MHTTPALQHNTSAMPLKRYCQLKSINVSQVRQGANPPQRKCPKTTNKRQYLNNKHKRPRRFQPFFFSNSYSTPFTPVNKYAPSPSHNYSSFSDSWYQPYAWCQKHEQLPVNRCHQTRWSLGPSEKRRNRATRTPAPAGRRAQAGRADLSPPASSALQAKHTGDKK